MRNSEYLQKRIIFASIKTLQIKLFSSRLMFNNLTNPFILTKKKSMFKVMFHFSKSTGSIKTFLKKCLERNLGRKEYFANYFVVFEIFHEILLISRLLNIETSLENMCCIILRNTFLAPE